MTTPFEAAYKQLNDAQRQAVDAIDGPVLVVAGPGTGKTQLLSLRVANIIRTTDTAPGNILCLTFTDNASRNMRERLETIIGQPASHVAIHTFHSFGGEVISQYGDHFRQRLLLQQIDELGRYELLRQIFETLAYSNPLSTRLGDEFIYLKNTMSTISWLKQNGLAPAELRQLLKANGTVMKALNEQLASTFQATASPKLLDNYRQLLAALEAQVTNKSWYGFPDYARSCAAELAVAIDGIDASSRYAPTITAWRNRWCVKDESGKHIFKDGGKNLKKMLALADVYEQLLERMSQQGLYDFDDMIMEVVHALEQDDELRLNLQERYQYILVDEFQDTNKAQLRMLSALGDNPLFEGRPNIMTVGDDDQAIYAFQGAEVSNMVAFSTQYRDTLKITLNENYRSTAPILEAATAVANQVSDRLQAIIPDVHKQLHANLTAETTAILAQSSFTSELAQYEWIAGQVEKYIKQGVAAEEIAVLAPRHKYLERLMPYLGSRQVPVAYERREDILQAPLILQLITMAQLVIALSDNRQQTVDMLLGQVLSYEFWQLPNELLVELSLTCYTERRHWLEVISERTDQPKQIVDWLLQLAAKSALEPLEYVLDELMGGIGDGIDSQYDELVSGPDQPAKLPKFRSPLRDYYFNNERYEQSTDRYLVLLGQLSTLRQRLREWRPDQLLTIKDLVIFVELHRNAKLKIIDTNPHTQTTNAVQVMTAYKAKGLEFTVVFIINAQDEVWGPTARSQSSNIPLPRNLPIAPASDGDNDKLRLLFVALTRAKQYLHITGYSHSLDTKVSPGLSFISPQVYAGFAANKIEAPTSRQAIEILSTDWAYRFRQVIADKPTLFEPILKNYKLSVTHLNNFIDVAGAGPQYFMLHNLLRFPAAPSPSAAYGDAVHKTLQWAHNELKSSGTLPKIKAIQSFFSDSLQRKHLKATDFTQLDKRGLEALATYFAERGSNLDATDAVERGFNNEGVVVAGAQLSGKIDKLQLIGTDQAVVIDFKTGKPARSWQGSDGYEKIKLRKYRQQLLFYKLLVEGSATYGGKRTVKQGALEFIEPANDGQLMANLTLEIDEQELETFRQLVAAVWQHIITLNFPDTSQYEASIKGINDFERDLLSGTI